MRIMKVCHPNLERKNNYDDDDEPMIKAQTSAHDF